MISHDIRGLGISACLAVLLFCPAGCRQAEKQALPLMVAEVNTMVATPVDLPVTASFVAQLQSSHRVDIIARVSGYLEKIAYREGEMVREGDLLFQMDARPFKAQVDFAAAEVDRRKAELWNARVNLGRIKPLAAQNAVSQSALDEANGRFLTAEAVLAQTEAQLRKAELELGYTTMRSPISGVAGQALVREGTYLAAGGPDAKLTYVSRLDPLWVEFSVSQNQFLGLREQVARGLIDSPDRRAYVIAIELADGKKYPHVGRFTFADPSFSQQTGTFLVRAEMPNPEGALLPGMFVRALVEGAVRRGAILVPQKAVLQTANGHMVYVVNDKKLAESRPVVAGEWAGHDWVIDEGLRAGERVIVDGFQRLAPGMPVRSGSDPPGPATTAPPQGR